VARILTSRIALGAGYALAAMLIAASLALASSPRSSGALGLASPLGLTLLGLGFLAIIAVAGGVLWRLLTLLRAQTSDAGARLHLRFVTLFAMAAVAPAVIVALFFGVLVTRGVDNWFSTRVQTVVENSATVARSYVEEQKDYIGGHVASMARELNRAAPTLGETPIAYANFLRDLAADNGFSAAYLIDRDGRVLARSDGAGAPPFLDPPPASFKAADDGDVSANPFESANVFRALYRLRGYSDAYLYVVRPVDRGIFSHLFETQNSLAAYRAAKARRALIQGAFTLSYLETVLWVLVGAVWVGMSAASSIAGPVARLVQAAGKVAGGDLSARVDTRDDPEEIAVLSRAFNRMTHDLQEQREALRAAHVDAESRRMFMETVLLGVSAGVVGLDPSGRVSAVNRQARRLLGLGADTGEGEPLSAIAPELEPVAAQAAAHGGEADEDIDVVRGGEVRRLRVRVSHSAEGLVLTFDDITRLITAQRNAAWRDVARRIAHEIKNPLTPIQLSAERLTRKYRDQIVTDVDTFDRCTGTIIRQVGDIGRMVDEFSAFARMPAPRFAAHDPAELLRHAVFAQRVADPDVAIEMVEPPAGVTLVCDGRIVGQALANVLKNAGEAIAARRALEPGLAGSIRASLRVDADSIAFEVQDNGVGLPVGDRDRLIEPYVTTREKGTGLGLAIVDRILEDHGGRLTLGDADCPPGAKVVLSFPNNADAGHARSPAAVAGV
jgi:two-component system nitrogen regulation sensor histidine kinase NtrY